MKITVERLFNNVQETGITLLSGKDGLNRVVRWVQAVESEEICTFLNGEEVIVITGVGINEKNTLEGIVSKAIKYGASGIIINAGHYIKEISEEIIHICEENSIPLFNVPWSTRMAEVMRKFYMISSVENRKEKELALAVMNAINFPLEESLYLSALESYGVQEGDKYTVLVISTLLDKDEINKKMLGRQVENYIYSKAWPLIKVDMDNEIILLFKSEYTEEMVLDCAEELIENCTELNIGEMIKIGIGETVKGVRRIHKSYCQAKKIIEIKNINSTLDIKYNYSSIGIYKVFLNIENKEVLVEFVEETIGKLLNYDKVNECNLEEVMRMYLKCNGSVKDVADNLYIHRNTVNYKIAKINKILEANLSNYEECLKIYSALKIYDILKVKYDVLQHK